MGSFMLAVVDIYRSLGLMDWQPVISMSIGLHTAGIILGLGILCLQAAVIVLLGLINWL